MRSLWASISPAAAEHALGQLLLAHFQREDRAGQPVVGGDVLDDVHREGRFAHRRPGRDDDHFAVLQAVEHVVHLEEPGLQPALAAVFDHLENLMQHLLHRLHRAADFFLGDLENSFLGLVQHHVGLLVRGIGVAQDFVAGGDQLPQHRLFANDPGIVHAMRGRGNRVEDLRRYTPCRRLPPEAAA